MIELKPVEFLKIQPWMRDYQKKSKNYEMPPDNAEYVGIYKDNSLVGYFITVCAIPGILEINQGYLIPEVRHKNLSKMSMALLEQMAKKVGFKSIVLGTNRAAGSYIRFMDKMGYSITRAIFCKEL